MNQIKKLYKKQKKRLRNWGRERFLGLFFLNLIVMLLVLLRSAGYFDPYYSISVNFIVIISIILAIFLLGLGRKAMFILTIFFWVVAALFESFSIDVWAERAGLYAYQALFLGVLLLLIESVSTEKKRD